MQLSFDEKGFLFPHEPLVVDVQTVEQELVAAFPDSKTRSALFVHFMRYLDNFKSRVSQDFTIWLNGSFATRKANPKDLDFVVFLDYRVYEAQEPFLDKFWTFSLEDQGLDAYLVKVFPADHPLHPQTLADRSLWLSLYRKTKWNRDNTFYSKGFLELNFF
jgi:hypothetical protein